MALGFKRPIPADAPRLQGHETDYRGSHGGWVKPDEKPTAGTPRDGKPRPAK